MAGKKFKIRDIPPDPLYRDITVGKFIDYVMERGKKNLATRIVYQAFDIIKNKTKGNPIEIFELALRNATPLLEVRSQRVGGAVYQVPREVDRRRGIILAMRWIIKSARSKKGKPMSEKLAQELIDASNNTGGAVRKKENVHKMAKANRAFAHFAR